MTTIFICLTSAQQQQQQNTRRENTFVAVVCDMTLDEIYIVVCPFEMIGKLINRMRLKVSLNEVGWLNLHISYYSVFEYCCCCRVFFFNLNSFPQFIALNKFFTIRKVK